MAFRGRAVLLTGASSGIGAVFARRFAERGADLVLVARRERELTSLASELAGRHGVRATAIPADLAEPGAGTRLAREVEERGIAVDTLVNNAGAGSVAHFTDAELSRVTAEIQLNATSLVELTHHFLPRFVGAGRGTVLNVASMTAYLPVPKMAVYAASKAFVLSFTEALWHETRGTGVTVLAFSPGPTRTGFHRASGAREGKGFQTPEQVVDRAFRVLDGSRRPPSAVSGTANRLAAGVAGLLPRRLGPALMAAGVAPAEPAPADGGPGPAA